MSTMTEVAKESGVVNYYDPSLETSKVPFAQGIYPAHIIKCDKITRPVRGKHQADIYNYRIRIHPSVSKHTYKVEDIDGHLKDQDGSAYINREMKSAGIFFFLTPGIGDDFEAHPGGNRKYMETVMALGVDCPEVEIDGKMVKSLPHLETHEFLGKPVLATVGLGKPWKGTDGVERQMFEVKSIDNWNEGETIDVEAEDLPF